MKFFKSMNLNSEFMNCFVKAVFAGFMIGIGGTVFLAVSNNVIGSFLFSIGLLMICLYKMNLYTGKVGYLLVENKKYIIELLITLFGNFVGTYVMGFLIRNTRFIAYYEKANVVSDIKINDNFYSIFILSFFCGVLMYIAVNNYKKLDNDLGKYLSIILCVMVFILCGFEHCVANMFYFSLANAWSKETFLMLFVMILGNSCGSIFISLFDNKCVR